MYSRKKKAHNQSDFLLDQGPIFLLTYLRLFGFSGVEDELLRQWWSQKLDDWASILDTIFWLDAQDDVLLERIHHRDRWHIIKTMSDDEAVNFLARYREVFWQIIPEICSRGEMKIIRFSSDHDSLTQIVGQILDAFEGAQS